MEENNNNNNVNMINNNNGRVRDFDLNKEPIPSPQVSGNADGHATMGEVEEVQSDQVPVVQSAMEGVDEVLSDPVPVVQKEPSKDKGKRPMHFSEEAHDKADGGSSAGAIIQGNIAAADPSLPPERKRLRLDAIKIRAPRVKVLLEIQNGVVLDDGYRWRKYGQKNIKGNKNVPRAYYRCSNKKCLVRKQVEQDGEDPRYMVVMYEGRHNHEPPTPMNNTNSLAAAAIAAQNAILRRLNGNGNIIHPMQQHPFHRFRYHTYEYGSSSNGGSAYPSPQVAVPFPQAFPTPPVAVAPAPPAAAVGAAAAGAAPAPAPAPLAIAAPRVNDLNLNLSLNINECGTSNAPAEECSKRVSENDDDQQN